MIASIRFFFSLVSVPVLLALTSHIAIAEARYTLHQCRVLQSAPSAQIDTAYSESLLWKIQRAGYKTSYLYGTIHVKEPRVLALPKAVTKALKASDHFIMESISTPEMNIKLSQTMFSATNDSVLNSFDEPLVNKTIGILSLYNIPAHMVALIQPWAAYITMNYPPGDGTFLDLLLLDLAKQQHKTSSGLESMDEQISIFTELASDEQFRLLLDSVCNYEQIQNDLKEMIELYLANDLSGLMRYSNQYSINNEPLYQDLIQKLIADRNKIMANRIIPYLNKQSNFIAIGALHLSGKDGVLSRLQTAGFTVSPIYY